jgi:hypothetical protein
MMDALFHLFVCVSRSSCSLVPKGLAVARVLVSVGALADTARRGTDACKWKWVKLR